MALTNVLLLPHVQEGKAIGDGHSALCGAASSGCQFTTDCLDQPLAQIFADHVLKDKAPGRSLQEGAPPQSLKRLDDLALASLLNQARLQIIRCHWHASHSQPEQDLLLRLGQAANLPRQHIANVLEHEGLCGQERLPIAEVEFLDGLRHQLQRQRVAGIALCQGRHRVAVQRDLLRSQHVSAGVGGETSQRHGLDAASRSIAPAQDQRQFAARHHQCALMSAVGKEVQHLLELFVVAAEVTGPRCIQDSLQVVKHQEVWLPLQVSPNRSDFRRDALRRRALILRQEAQVIVEQHLHRRRIDERPPVDSGILTGMDARRLCRQRGLPLAADAQNRDEVRRFGRDPVTDLLHLCLAAKEELGAGRLAPGLTIADDQCRRRCFARLEAGGLNLFVQVNGGGFRFHAQLIPQQTAADLVLLLCCHDLPVSHEEAHQHAMYFFVIEVEGKPAPGHANPARPGVGLFTP